MVSSGMPSSLAIRLWFFCKATINLPIAVEATSGISIIEELAEPRASSWSVVIPAVRATPVRRFENSTMSLAVDVLVVASLNMAEPVASIAFSIPIFGISPITSTILESAGRASSPISSPMATLILSAARTNAAMPSTPYLDIPSLEPS